MIIDILFPRLHVLQSDSIDSPVCLKYTTVVVDCSRTFLSFSTFLDFQSVFLRVDSLIVPNKVIPTLQWYIPTLQWYILTLQWYKDVGDPRSDVT